MYKVKRSRHPQQNIDPNSRDGDLKLSACRWSFTPETRMFRRFI